MKPKQMKLTVSHTWGSRQGTKQAFTDKARVNFGRKPDNDCVFDGDEAVRVSGHHAQIRLEKGEPIIQDLNSTNGTYVNGIKVRKENLNSGDQVRLSDDGPAFQVLFPESKPTLKNETRASKIYGQRTVGLMIQRALKSAGLLTPSGTSKPTAYFEALMERKLRIASTTYKRIILVGFILMVALGVGFGIYMYLNRNVTIHQHQTTQLVSETNAGGSVASANRYTVFMLAGIPKNNLQGEIQGFCTGFAISPNLLATNAHCIQRAHNEYTSIYALMNSAPKHRYSVIQMISHSEYNPSILSPDVGIVQINGILQHYATIAAKTELSQITPGIPVFLYGFPGRLNNVREPEATFIRGEIGRVTTFHHGLGSFEDNTLLQHSALVSSGTSGSPMFNASGNVIGINAGGYSQSGEAMPGYSFGMRIDLITPLITTLTTNN